MVRFQIIVAILIGMLIFGCAAQNQSQNKTGSNLEKITDRVGNLTFSPPNGFTKTREGQYFALNNGKMCTFYITNVALNLQNPTSFDALGTRLKSNIEAQGGQVSSIQKSQVNAHESIDLSVNMGGVDNKQVIIKFQKNYAIVQYGTADACASSFEDILTSITSIEEAS